MSSTNEIRSAFLDHFRAVGHEIVASAPLVPLNDPTLMFVNAGMVPFKNVFTGVETLPYSTAASSQKCVRAGGKHNDLDNVGYTARHHTFFEMLGNFSFGDYFKERAIALAWDLVHKTFDLPAERLIVTVFHEDDDAYDLWREIAGLPDDRILRIATADNFWSMGDTGPCGPCSEIFFDHGEHLPGGPPGSADEDGDRFVEIWNLVFMQFDQVTKENREDLKNPGIDTGMGLERIAAVLQGTHDNYEIDLFRALIAASEEETSTKAEGDSRASHRVIADHLRASSFLIADGVLPANEGRGYVLRRIMRRAMRHAHMLGAKDPLMHKLVPALTAQMGQAFPELVRAEPLIAETLRLEETRFKETLSNGLRLLDEAVGDLSTGGELPGEIAFKLYDTYGFPLDLTEDALKARGFTVDAAGFETAMAEQRAKSRAAWAGSGETATEEVWFDIHEECGGTEFLGYRAAEAEGRVQAIVVDGKRVKRLEAGTKAAIVTNQTPFYGESGGQIGDIGVISSKSGASFTVTDTKKALGALHIHVGRLASGTLEAGDEVDMAIDADRRTKLRANHSATHVLHEALRRVLGAHVTQKGSLVAPDRLRFDISHPKAITPEELRAVEAEVNAMIRQNRTVETRLMTPEAAIEAGALALFGEKYGDEVRVVSMGFDAEGTDGNFSVELCGGTHVDRLGDIGLFKIVAESAVSAGVRRIEALTGEAARQYFQDQEDRLLDAAAALKVAPQEVADRAAALVDERKSLERELAKAKRELASGGGGQASFEAEQVGDFALYSRKLDDVAPKDLRALADTAKTKIGSGVVALVAVNEGKAALLVGVTEDLTGRINAVDLVRVGAEALGGKGGGGRADMAQAGGPDGAAADTALNSIRDALGRLASAA
ncbi:MAG: alanine--tRNA ligase [Sphingomonadales bacterium]|nr:alanine--tRNA ligase [Sphingomonadales bacterium]